MGKRYENEAENKLARFLESEGWKVSKDGWPDFFCQHEDGRTMAVEVKPKAKRGKRHALKASQIRRLEWLQSLGADCFVGIEDELIPFDAEHEKSHYTRIRQNGQREQNYVTQQKRIDRLDRAI